MSRARLIVAVAVWFIAAIAVILPLVWLINNRDWGIGLMLLAPIIIYLLVRFGRLLAAWANPPPQRR